jgi:hypothetical protein
MVGGFYVGSDPGIHRIVIREIYGGLNFITSEPIERRLTKDFTRQPKTDAPVLAIFFGREVVEDYFWCVCRVIASYANVTPTLGLVGTHVDLETMPFKRGIPVVTNRPRQEVVLNIGPLKARSGADKATGLEMVGRAQARFRKDPLYADLELGQWIQMSIDRYRLSASVLKIDLQMIGEILADTGQFVNQVNTCVAEHLGRSDARSLEDAR